MNDKGISKITIAKKKWKITYPGCLIERQTYDQEWEIRWKKKLYDEKKNWLVQEK